MEKRATSGGVVKQGRLTYERQGEPLSITLGTRLWYEWLETATTFTFSDDEGTFTAHKTRAGNHRGSWYWRAYRHQNGRVFRCYLGVSANLTLPCLRKAALHLTTLTKGKQNGTAQDSAAPGQMSIPLVSTKARLPLLPVPHVSRTHLLTFLEKGATGPLTLLSAPAGSGKTTLLTEWARTSSLPVAWLSLEAADSDPARFLTYLLTTLRALDERIGSSLDTQLAGPSLLTLEEALSLLINDLARYLTSDVALVLDDYHTLAPELAQPFLSFLLEHLPEHLHLVLGTRADPPVALARMRSQGNLSELRADDLRFISSEVQHFLRAMDLDLASESLRNLEQRTEGWIAGVQLAALALRNTNDAATVLHKFRGNHRFLLEYMSEEILAQQTPQVYAFLLQTCMLERLCSSLCDAVTGESKSQVMLEELRKANLFVSALDETGEWYRYHPLFAESLRHLLLQQEPARFRELCAHASAWYSKREMFFEACEYALQARDISLIIPVLEQQISKLIGQAQIAVLKRWMAQLPSEIIADRPLLSVAALWIRFCDGTGNDQSIEQAIAQIQQRLQQEVAESEKAYVLEARANLHILLMLRAMDGGDTQHALELVQQTLAEVPADAIYLRNLATLCMDLAQGLTYCLNRNFEAAEHTLLRASLQFPATSYHFLNMIAQAGLADMYETQGHLRKSAQIYQRLLSTSNSMTPLSPEMLSWYALNYANLLIEWNQLDSAEEMLALPLQTSRNMNVKEFQLDCVLSKLRLCQARGQYGEAFALLQEVESELSIIPSDQPLWGQVAAARVRLLLCQGNVAEAADYLDKRGRRSSDLPSSNALSLERPGEGERRFAEYMALARVLIAQGRTMPDAAYLDQALTLLEHFSLQARQAGLTRRVLETQLLSTLALQAQGETQAALSSLKQVLSLAEPAGFVRLFIDEGLALAPLLTRLLSQRGSSARYAQSLLATLSSEQRLQQKQGARQSIPGGRQQREPLTAREEEVLALLAEGRSNQQIAARLVIAPNTAKRHVKHILAKLSARNRAQAIARAHELDLL